MPERQGTGSNISPDTHKPCTGNPRQTYHKKEKRVERRQKTLGPVHSAPSPLTGVADQRLHSPSAKPSPQTLSPGQALDHSSKPSSSCATGAGRATWRHRPRPRSCPVRGPPPAGPAQGDALPAGLPGGRLEIRLHQLQGPAHQELPILRRHDLVGVIGAGQFLQAARPASTGRLRARFRSRQRLSRSVRSQPRKL